MTARIAATVLLLCTATGCQSADGGGTVEVVATPMSSSSVQAMGQPAQMPGNDFAAAIETLSRTPGSGVRQVTGSAYAPPAGGQVRQGTRRAPAHAAPPPAGMPQMPPPAASPPPAPAGPSVKRF